MSQHDLDIANQGFPAFRGDLNSALVALGSTSKGPTAPASPQTGQLWVDDNTPSATVWTLNVFDGIQWIEVGLIDTTENRFLPFGGVASDREAKTANYTVVAADRGRILDCSGTITITLLAAATAGQGWSITIFNSGVGTVTIDGNAAETINGAATYSLTPNRSVLLVCDGTNWVIAADAGEYVVSVTDYGAIGDGVFDNSTAFAAARDAAPAGTVIIPGNNGETYMLGSTLTFADTGKAYRFIGVGRPTLKFSGLASTADGIVIGSSQTVDAELKNVVVDLNNVGRDGVVLIAGDHPVLDDVKIQNTVRDALFLDSQGSGKWIENAEFRHVFIDKAGRHAIHMDISGASGGFINEVVWSQVEVRGVSRVTAGGNAVAIEQTGSAPDGQKHSGHTWIDCAFDAQALASPIPDTHVMRLYTGKCENWTILGGGWENTGVNNITGGNLVKADAGTTCNGWFIRAPTPSNWGTSYSGLTSATIHDMQANAFSTQLPFKTNSIGEETAGGGVAINNIVTMPDQVSFLARNTADNLNVTGAGTTATVEFDSEIVDRNADYDNTTDTFTAPVTGLYFLCVVVRLFGLTAAATEAAIQINTSNRNYHVTKIGGLGTTERLMVVAIADMDAADTAKVQVFVSGEASDVVDVDGDATTLTTYFCGHLVA